MLRLNALGGMSILLNGEDITRKLPTKASALLVFCIHHAGRLQSKEKLKACLWGDSCERTARDNLRHNLWILKKILMECGEDIFSVSKEFCGIPKKSSVETDITEFMELYESEDAHDLNALEKMKEIYRGDFLDGVYLKKCIEYNDWIFYERESLQKRYFEVLHNLKKRYYAENKHYKLIELLSKMIQINPFKEEFYIEQIRAYMSMDDWDKAREKYSACTDMLRNELNESPGEILKELGQQIKNKKKLLPEKEPTTIVIRHRCYGGPEYELPSHLADRVIGALSDHERKDLEPYLNDLACLTSKWQLPKTSYYRPEDIRIYSSLVEILSALSTRSTVSIQIENRELLDGKSVRFLEYLSFALEGHRAITLQK